MLRLLGWKAVGKTPDLNKYLVIAAYHTSNWDFLYFLLVRGALQLDVNFLGKHTLFRWPLGVFMRKIGGVPIDRSAPRNFVENAIDAFKNNQKLALLIAPEGTRSFTKYWKTGFYYIATGANVPIVMGFVDYAKKRGGLGPLFYPTGDIEADFEAFREFYADKNGKFPEKNSPPMLRKAKAD